MALVAFDLDNTLGFFYHIGIWADFFSVETVENTFNRKINPRFSISDSVERSMRRAQKVFIEKLLKEPDLLNLILRPNLDAMILPLIKAKKQGIVRAICIYSNSWNPFVLHVAKELIETIYNCKGFFDSLVDASHPIRAYDWSLQAHGEPSKNLITLRKIFRNLCNVKGAIDPEDILFLDDREPKHDLAKLELEGLVYLKPTKFDPSLTNKERKKIFMLGLDVLDECDLLEDSEYLYSDVFHCKKYNTFTNLKKISNIYDLLEMAETKLNSEGLDGKRFNNDTQYISKTIKGFLARSAYLQ
jgi:hypothetical protein